MPLNKLPLEFLDLNDMGTQSRGVSVLYGRRLDGTLVAVSVDDVGKLEIAAALSISGFSTEATLAALNAKVTTTVNGVRVDGSAVTQPIRAVGSTNSYFADETTLALTNVFQSLALGFTSFNITFLNDSANVIEMSFDGVNVHYRFKVGEGISMDYRAQSTVYLRQTVGAGAAFRLTAY